MAFVTFRFVFGHTHAHQRADQPANRTARTQACKTGHDGPGCNQGANAWDGQRTEAGQDTRQVLLDAGFGEAEVEALLERGAVVQG